MIEPIRVNRRDLPIQLYSAVIELAQSDLVDRGAFPNPEIMQREILDRMTIQFLAQWRLPTEVMAKDEVVAEYPASLWDHIKKTLGLRHKTRRVRLNTVLAFPNLSIPPGVHQYVSYSYLDEVDFP